MSLQRHHLIKIYDQDGLTAIKTFSTLRPEGEDTGYVKGTPTFDSKINGGLGELVIDLALPLDNFDEGASVNFMNVVKVYAVVVDDAALTQTEPLVYTGFVSRYEPYLEADGTEGVRVTCLGLVSLLALSFYKSGSSFAVTHTAQDPAAIAAAVVAHFNTVFGGSLLSSSADAVGTAVSLTFTDQRHADALRKVGEVTGAGWWWSVNESGVYRLRQKPASPTHTFTVGKDVVRISAPKDSEKVVNDVQVRGAASLVADGSDAASQARFGTGSPGSGKRSNVVSDTTLADANALTQRSAKEVADNKDDKTKATIVVDTNYPIETVKVGETCRVRNLAPGVVPDNALIVAVRYDGDTITVELDEQPADFGRELSSLIASTPSQAVGGGTVGSGGGGGSTALSVVSKTANYTASTSDDVILCDATGGGFTVSLPAAASATRRLTVKKTDASANLVTVQAAGAEQIDGLNAQVLAVQYATLTLASNGTSLFVL